MAEHLHPRVELPHARSDDAAGPRHPEELACRLDRIAHEVEHELGEHDVEGGVVERDRFGAAEPNVDTRMPLRTGGDERFGRIAGEHPVGSETLDEHAGQRAGPAADVERHPPAGQSVIQTAPRPAPNPAASANGAANAREYRPMNAS